MSPPEHGPPPDGGPAESSIRWPELVSAALVGTARRPLTPVRPGDDRPPPEVALLDLAALTAARRRAGRRPDRADVGQLPVAGADRLPEVPPELLSTLAVLLAGQIRVPGGPNALVQEWLARCAAARRRLPHRHLAEVLDLAQSRPELRPDVAVIVDERGRWLAHQLGAWAWLEGPGARRARGDGPSPDDPADSTDGSPDAGPSTAPGDHDHPDAASTPGDDELELWRTGSRIERAELLGVVRARFPDRARALVEDTWRSDGAADRTVNVEALAVNLSMADEPFLEAALDDRSKPVRAAAAHLLDRLAESRRATRMAARALPLVRRSGLVRHHIEMAFPDEPDSAARRDGITDTRSEPMGLAAWWAVQVVAGTPLSLWEEHLGAPPDVLLDRAAGSDHLQAGWRRAALAQRDAVWCTALFRRQPRPELLPAIDPDAAADLVVAVLDRIADPQLQPLLSAVPGPWSADLSARVVGRLLAVAPEGFAFRPELHTLLARRLDPSTGPAVDELTEHLGGRDHQRAQVRGVRQALAMRATIHVQFDRLDEFTPGPSSADLSPPSPERPTP